MPSIGWSPRIVLYGADQTVYLVIDRFGGLGTVYRETEVERADLKTIIVDLMSGQFNDPIRVVAFNTLEHWSEDVTEYIAFVLPASWLFGSFDHGVLHPHRPDAIEPGQCAKNLRWG
jgi:hypothetical protein